jgi:hypothetical protein
MTIYSSQPSSSTPLTGPGTKDGIGSADHDQPYTFGRRPRAAAPFPFHTYQYARLLALRGRIGDGLYAADDLAATSVTLDFATLEES